jgi:hypothetical protein
VALAELALLPVLPCLILAPLAIIAIGVVLPLWIAAMALLLVAYIVVRPIEWVLAKAGVAALTPVRAWIGRMIHLLTHPTVPESVKRRL